MKSSDIHIKAISQEIPQPSITKICLKITCLKFHSNFLGANELRPDMSQVNWLWPNEATCRHLSGSTSDRHFPLPAGPGQLKLPVGQVDLNRFFLFISYKQIEEFQNYWSRASDDFEKRRALVNNGLSNGLLPDGPKQLPEPMLTYHQKYSITCIHLRVISQEIPQPPITKITLKII